MTWPSRPSRSTVHPRELRFTAPPSKDEERSSWVRGEPFMQGRAIAIDRDTFGASEAVRQVRAERLLATLRDGLAGMRKVALDLEASLHNFFPSLDVARALSGIEVLKPAVKAFVDGLKI